MVLAASLAAQADDIVERTLAAACLAVTCDGETLDAALAGHFAYLREAFPEVHALVVARLCETQSTMLIHALEGGAHD
jgi:hypothetical protein